MIKVQPLSCSECTPLLQLREIIASIKVNLLDLVGCASFTTCSEHLIAFKFKAFPIMYDMSMHMVVITS